MPTFALSKMKICLLLLLIVDVAVVNASIPRGGGAASYLSASHFPRMKGGGGLFGWFRREKSVSQYYRETLEEQVLLLDRQLRQARSDVAQLRDDRASGQVAKQRAKATTATRLATAQKVQTLTKQIVRLEAMKLEMEELLKDSATRVEELEAKLLEQETLTKEWEQKYQAQLEELQLTMQNKAQAQLSELSNLMEERVAQAAEVARQTELVKVDQKIAEITEELRKEHLKALMAERKRSAVAVEQEKKKMRKLVKALAIREKKLIVKAERDKQRQPQTVSRSTSSSSSSSTMEARVPVIPKTSPTQPNQPITTPTTRGPM
jgi:paraquat-inducible protein B